MAEGRPAIPAALKRQVLMEAGHRCAIPVCGQTPVEIHHIRPWADVQGHTFDNLIALCPTDHARAERGDIDRKSLRLYKQNLAVIQGRYGGAERRLLDLFVRHDQPEVEGHVFKSDRSMDFEFMYLIEDGLLKKMERDGGVWVSGVPQGPEYYVLTQAGEEFLKKWREGKALEPPE